MSEGDVVPVEILDAKFLDAVRLDPETVINLGTAFDELVVKHLGVIAPEVGVPHVVNDFPVRDQLGACASLRQHHDESVALDHAEIRRLVPEPVVGESKLVAIIIGRLHHVRHEEDRCAAD